MGSPVPSPTENLLWPEDPSAGEVLPLRKDPGSSKGLSGVHLAWPNFVRGTVNALNDLVTAPGKAYQGKYDSDQLREIGARIGTYTALNSWPGLVEEGLAGSAEREASRNVSSIFAGVKAKTADMPKLGQALTLEGRGASPRDIHAVTGWFRGPDNKWRFEIPDKEAMLHGQNVLGKNLVLGDKNPLEEVLHHPDLYSAYPQLQNLNVQGKQMAPGAGAYFPKTKSISLPDVESKKAGLSTLLHETQHGVQDIEGFAEGGSPDEFLGPGYQNKMALNDHRYDKAAAQAQALGVDPERVMTGINMYSNGLPMGDTYPHLKTLLEQAPDLLEEFKQVHNTKVALNAEQKAAYQKYNDLAGEVEARNVQERHQFGYGQETPPWETPGIVPLDKQIVVLDGKEQPRMATPVEHDPFLQVAPVEHDPFLHSAQPVDHDPFSVDTEVAKQP